MIMVILADLTVIVILALYTLIAKTDDRLN